MEQFLGNIHIEQDATLAIIAAILGVAFPIMVQVIGQIDTKYGSTRLVQRIRRSWQFRFFVISLGIAISVRIYYCFAPPRVVDWGKLNPLVDNSAILLVVSAVIILIVSLFIFIFKVLKFYHPTELFNEITRKIKSFYKKHEESIHIQKPNQSSKETPDGREFNDWKDLALAVIISRNDDTVQELYESLYELANIFTKGMKYKEVVFPNYFYNLLRSINKSICQLDRELSSYHNGNVVIQIMIDDFLKTRISQQSYSCMWMCLLEQLFRNREDLIFQYWTWAYQHYTGVLSNRLTEGEITDQGIKGLEHTVSAEDVENRENDRFEFQMFNTALGGLLLYKECYKLLYDIFYFKQSTFDSSTSLIPDSYSRIIDLYLKIQTNYTDIVWLERKYPFIDLRGGVFTNNIIKHWIEKYLAVLIIRVEYMQTISSHRYHAELPGMPDTIAEKQGLAEQLDRFIGIIEEVVTTINIHEIDSHLSKTPTTISVLTDYVKNLRQAIDRQAIEQEPYPEFIQEFLDTAKTAANSFFEVLKAICDKKTGDIPQPYTCQLGFPYVKVQEKSLYCIKQVYSRNHCAEMVNILVKNNLYANLGHKLLAHTKKCEVCLRTDLLHVLDKLNIKNGYIAILSSTNYGNWFDDMEKKLQKVAGDFEYRYKDTPLFKLNLTNQGTCMWVLRTDELPKYGLGDAPLNNTFSDATQHLDEGIFANIIDLYRHPEIKSRLLHDGQINYDKSVLELLDVNINLHYGDNARILRVVLTDQWSNTPYTIWDDVKSFDEYF
ncbi:MAG: hypothetical protein NC209_00440 [Alistipes sp.]|nr:hypothetical protein [Lachnospiraceae bacterium]MCM1249600.1 hypothetical protein [Alistipes sp.]